jgi:hypothetical protein
MNTLVAERTKTMKSKLMDIALDISWAKIAQKYFGKSTGWLYHKLDGKDSHGNDIDFTEKEKVQLREALLDLSERIAKAAENIQ